MWPFEKKEEVRVERKSFTIPLPTGSLLEFAFGAGGYMSNTVAMGFYRKTASIATAVDMIAGAFEQMRPVLKTEDDEFINEMYEKYIG